MTIGLRHLKLYILLGLLTLSHLCHTSGAASLDNINIFNNLTHNIYQFTISPVSALPDLTFVSIYLNTDLTYTSGFADSTYKSCAKYLIQLSGASTDPTGVQALYTAAYSYQLPVVSSQWLWQAAPAGPTDVQGTVNFRSGRVNIVVNREVVKESNVCSETAGVVIETTYKNDRPSAVSPPLVHVYSPAIGCCFQVRAAQPVQTSGTTPQSLVSFSAVHDNRPYTTKAVFIDVDRQVTTGQRTADANGKVIGADYKLVNDKLYSWSAGAWKPSNAFVTMTGPPAAGIGTGTATWTLTRSNLGDAAACRPGYDVIYQVSTPTATASTPITPIHLPSSSNRLAVPMYVFPCTATYNPKTRSYPSTNPSCTHYSTLMTYISNITTLAVLNPDNGPSNPTGPLFPTTKSTYRQQIATIKSNYPKTSMLLGYVASGYAVNTTAAYIAQVTADINNWYRHYSTGYADPKVSLDGIFIDEVAFSDCSYLPFYTTLVATVRQTAKKYGITKPQTVVLNPGVPMPECYVQTGADIFLLFEDTCAKYLSSYTPAGWEYKLPPSRIWHLLHSCSSESIAGAINIAKSRGAGWVYATSDTLPNPWDTMPKAADWKTEYVAATGMPSCSAS